MKRAGPRAAGRDSAAALGRVPEPRGHPRRAAPFPAEWRALQPIRGGGAVNIAEREERPPNESAGAGLGLRGLRGGMLVRGRDRGGAAPSEG